MKALQDLKTDKSIIITRANKDSATVILHKTDYETEVKGLLIQNYQNFKYIE